MKINNRLCAALICYNRIKSVGKGHFDVLGRFYFDFRGPFGLFAGSLSLSIAVFAPKKIWIIGSQQRDSYVKTAYDGQLIEKNILCLKPRRGKHVWNNVELNGDDFDYTAIPFDERIGGDLHFNRYLFSSVTACNDEIIRKYINFRIECYYR